VDIEDGVGLALMEGDAFVARELSLWMEREALDWM